MSSGSIRLDVQGLPPAKSEALSMLGVGHSHADRVVRLLEVARDQCSSDGLGSAHLRLELEVRYLGLPPSDATNYLGGVADVLEDKSRRGALDHLHDLAAVGLYDNDRQIREVRYRLVEAEAPSYSVVLTAL